MKLRSLGVAFGFAAAALAGAACHAAGVPVTVNATSILDIQSYTMGEEATDQVYLYVTGVQDGKAISQRLPKDKTWSAGPKKPAVDPKSAVELWKGELDNGQFVLLTVSLFQGKGDEALNKKYLDSLSAADQKVSGWNGKTVTAADVKKLAEETLKADREVVTKIKDTFSREKNTDHFGGQFTLIIWNDGGKLKKRLDPVGLTFGEHYGNDIKIYTKLKNTRNNVLVKNEQGEWEEQQLEPISDDMSAIRVKELETEYVKQPGGNPLRHTTDYIVELKVLGPDGKPLNWATEDEQTGIDNIHTYWNYAD